MFPKLKETLQGAMRSYGRVPQSYAGVKGYVARPEKGVLCVPRDAGVKGSDHLLQNAGNSFPKRGLKGCRNQECVAAAVFPVMRGLKEKNHSSPKMALVFPKRGLKRTASIGTLESLVFQAG